MLTQQALLCTYPNLAISTVVLDPGRSDVARFLLDMGAGFDASRGEHIDEIVHDLNDFFPQRSVIANRLECLIGLGCSLTLAARRQPHYYY